LRGEFIIRGVEHFLTPLVPVAVSSVYGGKPLPARMALATPDTARSILAVVKDLENIGFVLKISDLYRSAAMQDQAHQDYLQGRRKAYSPPAGASMHEAGRAMDIDLSSIGVPLARFWEIASAHGFKPVIDGPDSTRSEAWHFDCRGSHDLVYRYVAEGKAGVSMAPYTQMAVGAILACAGSSNRVPDSGVAWLQAALIRLGFDPGRIDGVWGSRTRAALRDAGFPRGEQLPFYVDLIGKLLKQRFISEYQ
jgi:hypothetical protein